MSDSRRIICPACRRSDQVDKVSAIYLEGLGAGRLPKSGASHLPKALPDRMTHVPPEQVFLLSRRLTPPSTGRDRTIRPIHPDLAIIGFSLILPVFLFGIWNSQQNIFLPSLVVLAVFYVLYFLTRNKIISRFEKEQAARNAIEQRVRKGIEKWMDLYYCSRDEAIFDPRKNAMIPIDELQRYLLSENDTNTP